MRRYSRTSSILIFALITILITVLGVSGLSAFLVTQSRKEISIRKVLGDDPAGIIALFSKKFTRLTIISFALAAPIAWLLVDKWLNTFANHIKINLLLFITPLVLTFVYTIITVTLIATKESNSNPVRNLRYE